MSSPSPANRSAHLNPRLQPGGTVQVENPNGEEVKKVLEIMLRSKKRNLVLVGDSEPEEVVKKLLRKIKNKELGFLKNVEVVSMEKGLFFDKKQIAAKIEELRGVIESRFRNGCVILDLGDLKWLVEQQQKQPAVSETAAEMTKLLGRFGGGDNCNK